MSSWIEVDEGRLTANLRVLEQTAGADTQVLAVVKANAYGHGLEACAVVLAQAGAGWLGVTCAAEGTRVRTALAAAGVETQPRVLVMSGSLPGDREALARDGLTPVVWTAEQCAWLVPGTAVHVEIDTGLSRQGVPPGEPLGVLLEAVTAHRHTLDGILTHYVAAERTEHGQTLGQQRAFAQAVAQVASAGLRHPALRPAWVHVGNSSALDNPAAAGWLPALAASVGARAMVRPGLALYGYCLPLEPEGEAEARVRAELQPVMAWKTRLLAVREVEAGATVGYSGRWRAERRTRVGLLPVGYADGLRRELSSTNERAGGWVMVRGRRAPILGRVSMNLTVVDLTAVPAAEPADEVVLLGDGVTAEDHARLADTIAYDILCGVKPGC